MMAIDSRHDDPQHDDTPGIEIAIIGMAGRFPGAPDVAAFWRNIRDGVESVTPFTDDELRARGVPAADLADPAYVKAGVRLDGMDRFDAGLFGYTPREAEQMDPQQRIFLECAWEALEHAGHAAPQVPVGVYAGDGPNLYLTRHLLPAVGADALGNIADLLGLMSGNSPGSLCTRVAYKLNLRGPAVAVQTACSTSLTAVHTACQALLGHDCDMALAGGVWLNLLQDGGYRHQAGAILSPDGHCRAFDARAGGTLIGSGAGIVVLKRLADAQRDGDTVHAVIKGSAANNDGAMKVGYTAPSIAGQAEVIRAAHLIADVPADSIGYVEAHGTGTTLGDPIEMAALTQAFRHGTPRRGYCAVGSVKTNIGHLDAAAGVAGLIKTVMALKHRTLPPSLHFETPNPQIDFAASPFFVNTRAQPWPPGDTPRRAGVSAFGIGGTNVHVVLEEAPAAVPPQQPQDDADEWQVLPVSARDGAALAQSCRQLAKHLAEHPQGEPVQALADIAHTLQSGRRPLAQRCAVVADRAALAAEALAAQAAQALAGRTAPAQAPEVVFLFPGGGTQHARMGQALYRHSATFRRDIDTCCDLLRQDTGIDLRDDLFPPPGQDAQADRRLFDMDRAQPGLFIVEYAMARWWMHCGVQPTLMLGHSLGEYVAACLAGVFRLEDALRIVAARGRLMNTLAAGAMTAVPLAEAELAPFLGQCDIAAINGEQLCVLAGPAAAIEQAEAALRTRQHLPRRLHVAVASHSSLVEPIVAELQRVIAAVPRQAPRLPFLSNVTGRLITAEEATSPAYWARHLRGTVRFADGLREVLAAPGRVLLEVGPGETLAGLARQHPRAASAAGVWASQAHPQQHARNAQHLATTVAGLWTAGVAIDWNAYAGDQPRRRVPLPTYPFQRQSYWVPAPGRPGEPRPARTAAGPARGRLPQAEWLLVPGWTRTAPVTPPATPPARGSVLVLAGHAVASAEAGGDTVHLQDRLLRHLHAAGRSTVRVDRGREFARRSERHYEVRPAERGDLEQLLRSVESDLGPVSDICHLWSLDPAGITPPAGEALEHGFHSLLALAQALDAVAPAQDPPRVAITVVANQLEDVTGAEPLCPEKALLHGPCKVIAQELSHVACRVVDVVVPPAAAVNAQERLVRQIAAEMDDMAAAPPDVRDLRQAQPVVACRGAHRWVRSFQPLRQQAPAAPRLRKQGVYVITGGLGGVGLVLARHLAQHWQARLVLLGRSALPPRDTWASTIAAAAPEAGRLQALIELESLGAEVLALQADVADATQARAALSEARRRFGTLHGVIHSAGVAGGGVMAQRSRAAVDKVFAPKLQGTQHLVEALQDEPLDFMLLCSSLTAITGGFGQADYCAANCYLDAVAAQASRRGPWPVLSVNWDGWLEVGMARHLQRPDGVGIAPHEGGALLEALLSGPASAQVLVSTVDLARQFEHMQSAHAASLLLPEPVARRQRHPRPVLATPYTAPDGELEQGLADLWSDFLGIAPVGRTDNLFELGGDSLLAIQLMTKVRRTYGVELHPAAFFKTPTVAALAEMVESRLIDEIEQATPPDAAPAAADREPATAFTD
jgi:phthiocerol/phenolphthiocerol synthesis type-I polyketide synthase E